MLGIETGECPACHYLGWTYVEELDRSTRRLIANGAFAHPRRVRSLTAVR